MTGITQPVFADAQLYVDGWEAELDAVIGLVSSYPRFEYSGKALIRAGKMLAGDLVWNGETEPNIREAFQIANSWRNSHMYPMRSVRAQVMWHMRDNNLNGTTSARLKRMPAIRRKLKRETMSLNIKQLQDLGGVRVILPSIADVRALINIIRTKSHHELREEDAYIDEPKADGYRSHHLMFNFRDRRNQGIHDGRRIELQVRTRLQHSWATAVEAVGLFRGEDLKGGNGSPDWLRLFVLMSAELALAEECIEPPGVPSRHLRVNEIKSLSSKLQAIAVLDEISLIVKWTDQFAVAPRELRQATHYIIKYDRVSREVTVDWYIAPRLAVSSYNEAEFLDFKMDRKNIVLVEVDKIENLKEAYPNYFGDVQLFRKQLVEIVKRKVGARIYFASARNRSSATQGKPKFGVAS